MLPDHRNVVTLDEGRRDRWGLPVLKIGREIRESERLMRRDMAADVAEMLEAAGAKDVRKDVRPFDGECFPGMGIHGTGTACQNPSLTDVALTARAADVAVRELRRRDL